jgi:hypothetical protein
MVSDGEVCRQHGSQHRRGLYLRTYFEIPDPAAATDLTLKIVYRGGARVFVSGEEIGRGNSNRHWIATCWAKHWPGRSQPS